MATSNDGKHPSSLADQTASQLADDTAGVSFRVFRAFRGQFLNNDSKVHTSSVRKQVKIQFDSRNVKNVAVASCRSDSLPSNSHTS